MRRLQDVLTDDYGLGPALEGFETLVANDISADGRVIVGYGMNADDDLEGFVVIIPEPAAASLFAVVALTTLAARAPRGSKVEERRHAQQPHLVQQIVPRAVASVVRRQGSREAVGGMHGSVDVRHRVRRLLVETAWHYQHRPSIGVALARRRKGHRGA